MSNVTGDRSELTTWVAFIQDETDFDALKLRFPGVVTGFSPEAFATTEGLNFGGVGAGGSIVYPTVLISGTATLLQNQGVDTAILSGRFGPNVTGHFSSYTWTGFILRVGESAVGPIPTLVSSCRDPDTYLCYPVMGDGDIYDPTIGGGNASLHPDGVGGYNLASWLELGVGGGVTTATLDIFGGVPLDLGTVPAGNGVGVAIQFAVNPVGMSGSFSLLWQLNGSAQAQLFGREVGGAREYEWRATGGLTLAATPKAVSDGSWDVLSLMFTVYQAVYFTVFQAAVCEAPFTTLVRTALKLIDVQSGATAVTTTISSGNTIDDMTFHRGGGAAATGWACTTVAFARTGLVIAEIVTPPINPLFKLCNILPLGSPCMSFNPAFCIPCYAADTASLPRRVTCSGPSPIDVRLAADSPQADFDPVVGVVIRLTDTGDPITPTCVRFAPDGCPVTQDDAAVTIPRSTDPLCLPIRLAEGAAINLDPTEGCTPTDPGVPAAPPTGGCAPTDPAAPATLPDACDLTDS